MNLYIMRHAQAQLQGVSDAQRALTEVGALEAKVMAKWLAKENIVPDCLLVSPYLRARQTAASLIEGLSLSVTETVLDLITPSGSPLAAHDYIDGMAALEPMHNVLIVSHMPLVSYLTEELTVDRSAPIYPTAAIAEISYDLKRMKGHFKRLVAPEDVC
jgi:phosphohistidine phosphatase